MSVGCMSDAQRIAPDGDFLRGVLAAGGEDLKKCFQCATCSVVCELSGDTAPFPRKEMIWAQWGLKDRLVADPDVWLCHQCNDCSTRCPRGARPGDVMAAVRRETVLYYAVPAFLGRWANDPKFVPLLLGVPAVLLGLLLLGTYPPALGPSKKLVFSYWNLLPHWVLMSFFGLFSLLAFLAVVGGVVRFWRAMKSADERAGNTTVVKPLARSAGAALKRILTHDDFAVCTAERWRAVSHFCVLYGFLALFVVSIWVMTARYNPLVPDDFAYPFSFWSPWRMLANLGGVLLTAGCVLMIWDRLKDRPHPVASTFSDWALLAALLAVALTGFLSEALHYARMEPHRQIAYFIHLVFVFALLIYLPYSKLAHLAYRATAMVYAEHTGRTRGATVTHEGRDHP